PPEALRDLRLPSFSAALDALHRPAPSVSIAALEVHDHPAWRRIQFEELLVQQISLRRAYNARRAKRAPGLKPRPDLTRKLAHALPFSLTWTQARAVA